MANRVTDLAQRRLLEALSEQEKTPGGIAGMLIAMPYAVELAEQTGQSAMARVWTAFGDLMTSVQADLQGVDHG